MGRKRVTADSTAEKLATPAPSEATNPGILSTGSTLLNLACSGKAKGGFFPGHVYLLVGDSGSGKSFFSLTCMAEATIDPDFQDHRLIFNNPENSVKMDLERFFGRKMADKLETEYSSTVEEFYYHVDTCCQDGRPFVYVLDSMDALSSSEEVDNFQEAKLAKSQGKEGPGSYGTSKAKANSQGLRLLMDPLRKTGSILVIISQTRDNIGFGAKFQPKTRAGGKSLKFYCSVEIWTAVRENITRSVKGKQRQLGIRAQLHVKKNRLTGKDRTVEVPIYHSSGIDDVGSCVEWLIDEKKWKESNKIIDASEFEFVGKSEDLIDEIQQTGKEDQLRELVQAHWDEIERLCRVERKNRYE